MSKFTPKQIDDRRDRAIATLTRALQRGDITGADFEDALTELAQWSAKQYAKLPVEEQMKFVKEVLDVHK